MPHIIWKKGNNEHKIYLTFDDGPDASVTSEVLNVLDRYNAKATFFVLGERIQDNLEILKKIEISKHQIGNHGFRHLDGWKCSFDEYEINKKQGEDILGQYLSTEKCQFRPPYGHFRGKRAVVLWSLMSGDFDKNLSKEECLNRLIKKTRAGDIIVFHDNLKSFDRLKWVLPRYLSFCQEVGFKFGVLSESND